MNAEEWKKLTKEQQAALESLRDIEQKEFCESASAETMLEIFFERLKQDKELVPHINAELQKARKDPGYYNMTVWDILADSGTYRAYNGGIHDGQPHEKSKTEIIIERAIERQAMLNKYPAQPNYKIKSMGIANNPLISYMQERSRIGAGAFDLPAIPGKDITAYTTIAIADDKAGIYAGMENITEQERATLDRIYNLKKYADNKGVPCLIDGYTIAACMPGEAGTIRQKEAELYNSIIEKLRHIFITCDATTEMIERGQIREGETFILDDYCISATGAEYRTRTGKIKKGYVIKDIPLPHKYAEMTGQIISIPADLFNIRETRLTDAGELCITANDISMTQARQTIINYLLTHIHRMQYDYKRAKDSYRKYEERRAKQEKKGAPVEKAKSLESFCKMPNKISFATIFEKCNITISDSDSSRTTKKRYRDFCADALNYWKAKEVIKGYQIQAGKDDCIIIEL